MTIGVPLSDAQPPRFPSRGRQVGGGLVTQASQVRATKHAKQREDGGVGGGGDQLHRDEAASQAGEHRLHHRLPRLRRGGDHLGG